MSFKKIAKHDLLEGVLDERLFSRLKKLLDLKKGIELESYKDKYVRRRVVCRMREVEVETLKEYLHFLSLNPDEWNSLCRSLTTQTTHFFRDPDTFQFLKEEILPRLVRQKRKVGKKRIRLWSAGCATGEEPYSLAILLKETLGINLGGFKVFILATDLDETSLNRAREGIFSKDRLKEMDKKLLFKYFLPQNGNLRLDDAIKKMVVFERRNLFEEKEIYGNFDIITCRNFYIYLSPGRQESLMAYFHRLLSDGGIIVLGKSESLPKIDVRFEPVSLEEKIYRKINQGTREEPFYEK
jgi:chemotaxis protein methyltransferase CheR